MGTDGRRRIFTLGKNETFYLAEALDVRTEGGDSLSRRSAESLTA